MSSIWSYGDPDYTLSTGSTDRSSTTVGCSFKFDHAITVNAIWIKIESTGQVMPAIYDNNGVRIGGGSSVTVVPGWVRMPLESAVVLNANTWYKMCALYNKTSIEYYQGDWGAGNSVTIDGVVASIGVNTGNCNTWWSNYWECPTRGVNQDAYKTIAMRVEGIPPNTAPTIVGPANEDLGNKNIPFSINYSVNDADSANILSVVEKLNGSQINSISNAPRNTNFTINITKEILNSLPLNQKSTVQISVSDGLATTYKAITFTRTNNGPSITNLDKDLGQVIREGIAEKYSCHDVEGNTFTIVEKVDDIVLKNISGVDGAEYTIGIPEATWIVMPNGTHKYTITATDSLGDSIIRTFTFTKKETVIESTGLTTIIPTDAAATKILLTPSWAGKENADIVIEVCNNAFDTIPTWENATSQTLLNKPYVFTNKVKIATKWGIDIRFKLSLKAGSTGGVEFYGLGGAFE